MKTNKSTFYVSNIALVMAIFLSACSGKKQDHDHHDQANEKDTLAEMPSSNSATTQVVVFENVDPSVSSQINGFYNDYAKMSDALIEDNADGAKTIAKKLSDDVTKFDMSKLTGAQMDFYHTHSAKLSATLKNINESIDIEEIRTNLSTISESMYALVKAYHANTSELYYNFCPMAKNHEGAYWLTGNKEIRNPYMGQRMLRCGSTTETIN